MIVEKSDLLIGGQLCPPSSGQYYSLYSPVDGRLVAEVANATQADVDRAVCVARDAFYAEWKFSSVEDRRALFIRFNEVLHSMADDLATAKIQPQGGRAITPLIDQIIDYYMGKSDDGVGELLQHGAQDHAGLSRSRISQWGSKRA